MCKKRMSLNPIVVKTHVSEYIPICASAGDQHSCEFGSATYYAYCGFGGILSCGLTHTAVVPLDLVKCRIQVNTLFFKWT